MFLDNDLFHSQMGQNNCDHTFMHDPLQTSKYTIEVPPMNTNTSPKASPQTSLES